MQNFRGPSKKALGNHISPASDLGDAEVPLYFVCKYEC
jgi:hypothetical protein